MARYVLTLEEEYAKEEGIIFSYLCTSGNYTSAVRRANMELKALIKDWVSNQEGEYELGSVMKQFEFGTVEQPTHTIIYANNSVHQIYLSIVIQEEFMDRNLG